MAKKKKRPLLTVEGYPGLRWIAIDPGKRSGYAIVEGSTIVDCGTTTIEELCVNRLSRIDCAVIEIPRVYPMVSKWKGDPQILLMLAFECGKLAEWYGDYALVEPREWGGSAPKDVKWHRTMSVLTDREQENLPNVLSEHARDALGIACWALGRFNV